MAAKECNKLSDWSGSKKACDYLKAQANDNVPQAKSMETYTSRPEGRKGNSVKKGY